YNVRRRIFRLLHGDPHALLQKFNRLTDTDAMHVLEILKGTYPMQDEGNFKSLFRIHSAMMVERVHRALVNRTAPTSFAFKRRVVAALYLYAENPLHPDVPF